MTPQTLLVVRAVAIFVAGLLASRGLISAETQSYLAGPEALAFFGILGGAAAAAWGLWLNRPKGVIGAAGKLLEGKGAIIAPPSIADSSATPPNVVTTAAAAERLPGVH